MSAEHSFSNFPHHVEGEGRTWCCDMPGCGKRIAREKKSGITYHKYTHFPKLTCPHCAAAFPQKIALEQHIRINHTDERPYACQHCDKAFHQLSNLQDHVSKHHGTTVPPKPKPVATQKPIPAPKPNMTAAYATFYDATKVRLLAEQPTLRGAALISEIGRLWRLAKSSGPATHLRSNEDHATPVPRKDPGTQLPRVTLSHVPNTTTHDSGIDILEEIDIILRGDM